MLNKESIQRDIDSGLSLSEICKRDNLVYANAYRWCKRQGILLSRASNGKSRTTAISRKRGRVFSETDKDLLYDLYVVQRLPLSVISKRFNTSDATVAATLRRFDIPVKLKNGRHEKVKPSYSKQVLTQLYVEQKLSTHEIAKLLGYKHHGQVVEDMKYHNIERRSYKEAGVLLYEKHPEKREVHRNQLYAGITGPKTNAITSLEQTFMSWAQQNRIDFVYQFQIRKNWHRYDFLIKNTSIIVEMDGDFWHSLPEHVERDKKFDNTAVRHGYSVVRIRESDVKLNPLIFDEKLLPLLQETQQCQYVKA